MLKFSHCLSLVADIKLYDIAKLTDKECDELGVKVYGSSLNEKFGPDTCKTLIHALKADVKFFQALKEQR